MMYLAPLIPTGLTGPIESAGGVMEKPISLEDTDYLKALNGPAAFNGRLLEIETVAQEVERAGGYAAVIGKEGPAFLFDDRFGSEPATAAPADYMFVTDDMAAPAALMDEFQRKPPLARGNFKSVADRDTWFTKLFIERALPAAAAATASGRPALTVLWQRNPDAAQHSAGLGTAPAIEALRRDDANLGNIRAALARLEIAGRTDLMVVSDHGFATIAKQISLSDLLVGAGIKRARDSKDIVIAADGGFDLVYLSREEFNSVAARRAILQRIVDFAQAHEWAGPIFSPANPSTEGAAESTSTGSGYRGWIDGTFSQELVGIYNPARGADLVISFRELSEADNRGLTGPENLALKIDSRGEHAVRNGSQRLLRAVKGLVYSDLGGHYPLTTGMGIHGAAGRRELHNVCAAAGPDFRRHVVDEDPTANSDVAVTIGAILHQPPAPGASGRVMGEALAAGNFSVPPARAITFTVDRKIANSQTVSSLKFTRFADRDYLDSADVTHPDSPAGRSHSR